MDSICRGRSHLRSEIRRLCHREAQSRVGSVLKRDALHVAHDGSDSRALDVIDPLMVRLSMDVRQSWELRFMRLSQNHSGHYAC